MQAEIWIFAGATFAALGALGIWMARAISAELSMTDDWWTPNDPTTRANRDAERLLREANK